MKTILTAITIAIATITTADAQNKEAHCFKAEELEIEAQLLDEDVEAIHNGQHELSPKDFDIFAIVELKKLAKRIEAEANRLRRQAQAHQRKCEGG